MSEQGDNRRTLGEFHDIPLTEWFQRDYTASQRAIKLKNFFIFISVKILSLN